MGKFGSERNGILVDFPNQLLEKIKKLGLDIPIMIGTLEVTDSIALCLLGGNTLQEYYDGAKTKQLNYEFNIRTKKQELAISTLSKIALFLSEIDGIPSENGSYEFEKLTVSDEISFNGQEENGTSWYRLAIQVRLTIFKTQGEDKI